MKNNELLRKSLTFAADSLCIVLSVTLSSATYFPESSIFVHIVNFRSLIVLLILSFGMVSIILKNYNDPIMENLAASMIIAIGTFLISFIFSYVILVLITGQLYDIMFSISLIIYTVFFFCAYRLGDVVIRRIDHLIFRLRGTSDMDRVIIFGAGDAGKYLVDLLNNDKTKHLRAVAFIDDNPLLEGKKIKGLPVVGPRTLIPHAAEKYKAKQIIIAIPFVDNSTIRDIFNLCVEANCTVRRFGNMTTFTANGLSKATINEVRVEDLLGRDVVRLDLESVSKYISGRTILVTGGAGSIGLELCRQILHYGAKKVVIFDICENMLFEATEELGQKFPKSQFVTCIGSIQDRVRLREVFELYKPQVVFHAAAHKHVPMMELNPREALKNNVMGTLYLVETAIKYKIDRFILISTDKAVNPTNIMGASKRIAEMLIQRANAWGGTKFAAVRFGNVLGSNGSVVPLFKKQIQTGGPITVTDKNMKRYFMTIPEAVQLVLEAGSITKGGEIFVLDMGEPVSIYDLATSMIRLSGLQPEKDIKIIITGLRPGEKLYEEIRLSEESVTKTDKERIFVLKAGQSAPSAFETEFDKLCQSIDKHDFASAFKGVALLVPTFDNGLVN